jgi:hypothetical protein
MFGKKSFGFSRHWKNSYTPLSNAGGLNGYTAE